MANKPVIAGSIPKQQPVVGAFSKKPNAWTFSFKDFGQASLFGLNKSGNNWFSSLFERLKEVSNIDIETLFKSKKLQADFRYHEIDWEAENIPVKRGYFNWIDSEVLKNEYEFPFYQFHVSQAMGRVVGYWYEDVFHVVLFDPLHNLQPTKKFNYQIRPCEPVQSDLTTILYLLDKVKRVDCDHVDCKVKSAVMNISGNLKDSNAIILFLDDDYVAQLNHLSTQKSLSELV
jgi:hypothetical protein